MPLDSSKLERAVNTTEKLVRRMDAYESSRKDAVSGNVSKSNGGWKLIEGTGKDGGDWFVSNGAGVSRRFSSRDKAEKEFESYANSRKDVETLESKAMSAKRKNYEIEGRGKEEKSKTLESKAMSAKRKDDYGHPVKSNNRVQQTDYGQEADNKKSVDARRGREDA